MGKVIYLNFGQTIETKENRLSAIELRLEQIKKDYYKQLKGRQDTVKGYTIFLISKANNIEDAYQLLGY